MMQDVVYLRRNNEYWTVCDKGDPGAVAFAPVCKRQQPQPQPPRAETAEEWYGTGQPVPYKPADGQW